MNSYRNDTDSILLRSAHGSFSPTAALIDLGVIPSQESTAPESILRATSTLLHERHHWLQHIGTTAGIYNSLILHFESAVIAGMGDLTSVKEEDLPLLASKSPKYRDVLSIWEHAEAVRRLFFGCRVGDHRKLDAGGSLSTRFLTSALTDHLVESIPGPSGLPLSLPKWRDEMFRNRPQHRVVSHRQWIVGARHLMEFSARVSEMFKLAVDWTEAGRTHTDMEHHLAGVYGVAYDLFLKSCEVENDNTNTLVAAALTCDLALNSLYPPAGPALLVSPSMLFIELARDLRDFDFSRPVVINDPISVRELINELHCHLRNRTWAPFELISEQIVDSFGHLTPDAAMNRVFGAGDFREPPPNADLVWLASLWGESARRRTKNPELFALPSCVYTCDREFFHSLFDPIAPPVIKADGMMYPAAARTSDFKWLQFTLHLAVQADLLRGVMYSTVDELAAVLARYGLPLTGDELNDAHGRDLARVLFKSINFSARQGALGVSLVRKVAKILGYDSPL
ncbi:hypothetical protein [Streptomyces griseoflavus]|uniref:hypothetical protein n=1 Tax=Streptomyces griseoflavus TaxID=35619 RepID=UPI00167E0EA8|nr:hypothetical protein [Streptomyces griseoflavus]